MYQYSPLHRASFKPLRRLGMGIWDREKMVGLGLVNVPHADRPDCNEDAYEGTRLDTPPFRKLITLDDLICRWKSIESQAKEDLLGNN